MRSNEAEAARLMRGMRTMLQAAALLVLIIGFPVFLFPHKTDVYFAWTIDAPIMAAALGASYLAASFLEAIAARQSSWAAARIAVPAVLTFTILTLVVTVLHLDRFHLHADVDSARVIAWVWLAVYASVPLIMGSLWFLQARAAAGDEPTRAAPMAPALRLAWIALALVLLPLAAFLLVDPTDAATLWPWPLTALTGRATGAWLAGFGVLCAHAAAENDLARLRPVFPAVAFLVALQAIVLLRFGDAAFWARPSAWAYTLLLAGWLATALYAWSVSRASSPARNS
ncbi:MAG TPA: hypothetical protein VMU33_01910 [Burkholderiaceae bacterium]|nr:hypothetical protein [Burkholderiaceae bacterium]